MHSSDVGARPSASTGSPSAIEPMAADKAIFVLVHGGWHGGWCWHRVAPLLRAARHDVWTPTLTGLADRALTDPSWSHFELATGHDAMITEPRALAEMLLDVVTENA